LLITQNYNNKKIMFTQCSILEPNIENSMVLFRNYLLYIIEVKLLKIVKDQNLKNIIGPRLKNIRASQNITQGELSAKLEVMAIYLDRSSISKIERQNRIVTDYELIALSKVLKIDVNALLGLDE
jgi:DNA-binding XRE family transcriptional regulator